MIQLVQARNSKVLQTFAGSDVNAVTVPNCEKLIQDLEIHTRFWVLDSIGRMDRYLMVCEAKKPTGGCPTCDHPGNFIRMALVCPDHGAFAGC